MSIALNAKYPLHDGSGVLYSIRFALGLALYIGMRQQADRFLEE